MNICLSSFTCEQQEEKKTTMTKCLSSSSATKQQEEEKLKPKLLEQGWVRVLPAWAGVGDGADVMELLAGGDGVNTMES